ncbi:hypothetical protein GGE16_001522 [Rhizobium leguminosarum]|uniref:Uncharacterized protein n=1 Tax=Rhizobium leguminosarum TaxID=384 RepID=A0AAE2MHL9_RHILE|nr:MULTISPECIES: DUF6634 family protein [Rhizobium]MBB4289506.1 hypothetical protein [Rhizobium leguminosarum]MBB4294398.1 hypothetical protein [Rhizobium leguminosarum]MBB4305794.1 hypothetical protein [Rhizobium leguminosarum]MBB4418629.1 hypothetical protein [Rhizobium leguminosarum]MBB4433473.1 hypothetical protein [Rhizobium esperanzae]
MSMHELVHVLRSLADDLEAITVAGPAPMSPVTIEEWFLGMRSVPCLVGRAVGHPTTSERSVTLTSELFYLDEERGVARTLSRWYRLGDPVMPMSDEHLKRRLQ